MGITTEILLEGEWTIMQTIRNSRGLATEHLGGLSRRDYGKVAGFLERIATNGPLSYGQEKNRKLADQIFELKPTSEVRLAYFFDGPRRIIITH